MEYCNFMLKPGGPIKLHYQSERDICITDKIEDELHFLCICPYYQAERNDLYNYVTNQSGEFDEPNNEEKFVFLIKSDNFKVIKYLKIAWQKHKG